jgi:tRNA modification GTPase
MLELHTHGGERAPARVLQALLALGLRLAKPGEFSRRALLQGKQSLDGLEAIDTLISAQDEVQARASLYHIQGGLRRCIEGLREQLLDLTALLEANLDHPEEDLPELDLGSVLGSLAEIQERVERLAGSYSRYQRQREGVRVVLVGHPNVGKSSLLNGLLGEERAIVTAEPGTTRDLLEEVVNYRGMRFLLTDTAGLRSATSEAEAQGVARARAALERAHICLLVQEAGDPHSQEELSRELGLTGGVDLLVRSKADLLAPEFRPLSGELEEVWTSVPAHEGLDTLMEALHARALEQSLGPEEEPLVVTNLRHREALEQAREELARLHQGLEQGLPWDVAMVDLYQAMDSLGRITGAVYSEEILDRIFERFCLGK